MPIRYVAEDTRIHENFRAPMKDLNITFIAP